LDVLSAYRTSGHKERILIQKLCRISAALRQDLNGGSDFVGFLVVRSEHHGRDARLFSIAIRFTELDVAGSSPVSRSCFQFVPTFTRSAPKTFFDYPGAQQGHDMTGFNN
jgi:hypothetical protein